MELKKIIKSTSFLVSSKLVQFIVGLIKAKIGAIYIGTIGTGIYSQVNYLTTMISQVTLLSMNDGLVKQIAQNKDSEDFKKTFLGLVKAYSSLIIISVLVAFIVCIAFAKTLTLFFLGDIKYQNFYLFGISSVPILILNSLSYAILKSYKATKEISKANIISSIFSLLIFIPLILCFQIFGAVISVALNFAIALYINNYQARKLLFEKLGLKFKDLFKGKTEKKYNRELIYFAIFGASSGLIFIGAESVCRAIVVNILGIEKLGVYSPIISWSGLLTGFILPAVQVYLFPRYSECKSNSEISGVLNDSLYLITLITIPFILIAIPFRNILISIFYSKEFLEAGLYLPWHFTGMIFYMWWYVIALVLTPIGSIKVHSFFLIIISILNISIVYFLVPKIGLYGWMLKFTISPIIFIPIYIFYLRKRVNLSINKKNYFLLCYSFIASNLLIYLDNFSFKYILSFICILLTIFFISPSEKVSLYKGFRSIFKKK